MTTVMLPRWARAELEAFADNALENADWLEHGFAKIAAWVFRGFGELLRDVFGPDLPPQLRAALDGESTAYADACKRLAGGFRRRHGVYQQEAHATSAWVTQQLADAIGIAFERSSVLQVPRLFQAALSAAENAQPRATAAEKADTILRVARACGQEALALRVSLAMQAQPALDRLLGASTLPLEVLLGVEWSDDPAAQGAVLASQRDAMGAKPYHSTARFQIGDLLEHPKLGRGVVTSLEQGRVVVAFAGGERKLVHRPRSFFA